MSEKIAWYAGRPGTSAAESESLDRLLSIAMQDTVPSATAGDFLLSWWNAEACGGFNLARLWSVDSDIAQDMIVVTTMIARVGAYPDVLGYHDQFKSLVKLRRPNLQN